MIFSPKFKHINLLLAGILIAFSFQACKLDPNEGINWDADLLTPIAYGSVTIDDLVGDSSFFQAGSNNEAILIFRDTLASTNLSELVSLPDTSLNFVATLDSLALAANLIEQRVSLADIARQLIALMARRALFEMQKGTSARALIGASGGPRPDGQAYI